MIEVNVHNKHSTGTRRRAGMIFTRGMPLLIDEIKLDKKTLKAIMADEFLVVSEKTAPPAPKHEPKKEDHKDN